jgi:hypothetical protein
VPNPGGVVRAQALHPASAPPVSPPRRSPPPGAGAGDFFCVWRVGTKKPAAGAGCEVGAWFGAGQQQSPHTAAVGGIPARSVAVGADRGGGVRQADMAGRHPAHPRSRGRFAVTMAGLWLAFFGFVIENARDLRVAGIVVAAVILVM